ncbi:hypothetical protein [Burkholderia cenocepacia]|uniref:hypothetical protein n=1 Tax=Burkholderia cenocepacia TaxID=95486 RepID=UPI002ABE712B|nr:hypothetical protein [Burkholderia cenocepacia]
MGEEIHRADRLFQPVAHGIVAARRGATARAGISAPPDRAKRRSVCKALRQEPLRDVCFLLASMFLADVKGWNRLSGRNNGRLSEIFNGPAARGAVAVRINEAGVRQANA